MSFGMKFVIWLTMFAPVIVAVTLIVAIFIADAKHKASERYINELVCLCVQKEGYDFVHKILVIYKDFQLSRKGLIALLETVCNVEPKKTRRKKLWDGLRKMQNSTTIKVK